MKNYRVHPTHWLISTQADRETLLDATASLLEELDGAMYTGCDMNTTPAMMQSLHDRCGGRYVLAALANETCCPNTATAAGVLGAVTACVDGDVRGKTFVVHGCGGVGGAVAAGLVELGAASVKTCLLYTSPSPRDRTRSRMPSSA